jgi:DNA-3-methyladenine glycosylase
VSPAGDHVARGTGATPPRSVSPGPGGARVLPADFYRRPADEVAPDLLGKILAVGRCRGRIVEVEAYTADDPASHSYRGPTRRNATMFGPPGRLYVYRSYGVHWCANVVCGAPGDGAAVLLRALEPLRGLELMWPRRPAARRESDLCGGPGKLCAALAIDGGMDGAVVTGSRGRVRLLDDGTPPPAEPGVSGRVGISVATDVPWRWFVEGVPSS